MAYQILSPVNMAIDADTFYDAVKKYVKISRDTSINQLIIADAMKQQMKVDLNYYKVGDRNKFNAKFYNYYPNNRYPIRNNYYPNRLPDGPIIPINIRRQPEYETATGTYYPPTTIIIDDTVLPDGTEIIEGTILERGSVIIDGTYLPKGIYMPSGIDLTKGTEITEVPKGGLLFNSEYKNGTKTNTKYSWFVKLGENSVIPKDTFFPEGTIIKSDTIIKNGSIVKRGTTFPKGTIFKETSFIDKTTIHQNGSIIKGSKFDGITIPLDTIIVKGTVIKSGTIIPKETSLPKGSKFKIIKEIDIAKLASTDLMDGYPTKFKSDGNDNNLMLNGSKFKDGGHYKFIVDTEIKEGTIISSGFEWNDRSSLGSETIIKQDGPSKSVSTPSRFIIPAPSMLVPGTYPGVPDIMRLPTMMQPGIMQPGIMQPGMMRQQPRMVHIPQYRR